MPFCRSLYKGAVKAGMLFEPVNGISVNRTDRKRAFQEKKRETFCFVSLFLYLCLRQARQNEVCP